MQPHLARLATSDLFTLRARQGDLRSNQMLNTVAVWLVRHFDSHLFSYTATHTANLA